MRGSWLLLPITEHFFGKKELKSSSFFFWELSHTYYRGKEVEWGVSFYYSKAFLIMPNKILYFFVYESIHMLFWNDNLVWKLRLRYVGLFAEVWISSSIVCYYWFYYFDSFFEHCFSLGWDFLFFFANQWGSLSSVVNV